MIPSVRLASAEAKDAGAQFDELPVSEPGATQPVTLSVPVG